MPLIDEISSAEAREFIAQLSMPPKGRLVIATASDPRMPTPFGSSAPVHVCELDDMDLAFDHEEIARFFDGLAFSSDFLPEVQRISGGFAAGVSLARRLLRNEGESVARNLEAPPYLPLKRHVYERIISVLSPDDRAVLVTIISIGDSRRDILHLALPGCDIEAALRNLTKRGLLAYAGGRLSATPLVAAAGREHCSPSLSNVALGTIDGLNRGGAFISAALVASNIGNAQSAFEHLLRAPAEHILRPSVELDAVLKTIPESLIATNARVWICSWRVRRFRIDIHVLIAEAEALLDMVEDSEEPVVIKSLRGLLMFLYIEAGDFVRSDALLEQIYPGGELPAPSTMDVADVAICGYRATGYALQGRLIEAAIALRPVSDRLHNSYVLQTVFNMIGISRARGNGNWQTELVLHAHAIEIAGQSGDVWAQAAALAEFIGGAVFACDSANADRARSMLRDLARDHDVGPFAQYGAIAGCPPAACAGFGQPYLRARQLLVEAYYAGSAAEARVRLLAGIEAADVSGALTLRIGMRIALAPLVPQRQAELLDEASALAQITELLPVCGAISQMRAGELPARNQPFRALVRHMRALHEQAPEESDVVVNVLGGTVERGGRPVNVSRKVLDLLTALSVRSRSVERDELCEMLWPDEEPGQAVNALKMTVRRARLQCGDARVVCFVNNAYVLGADVGSELQNIRSACELALKEPAVLEEQREALVQMYGRLAKGAPAHLNEYEWFIPTAAMLQNLQVELSSALARDIIRRADFQAGRALTQMMLEFDTCDETAWELLIRLNMSEGNTDAARRTFAGYRRVLQEELRAAPSARLAELLAG
ncbi:MAG: hypothetical protein ABR508_08600 [Candidatus Baltobacteraceae bacterium]